MEQAEEYTLTYTAAEEGDRLDAWLARVSGQSRAQVQRRIAEGEVLVNGSPVKAKYQVRLGDRVEMRLPPPVELDVLPEDIPLEIVYQDEDICVINKPQGMVVHPAPGNESGTLVNALLFALSDLSGIGGVARPGIVHRIDKMTSGLLVVAKNDAAHASLSQQLQEHTARRSYLAIVEGNIREDAGTIEAPIARHPVDRKRMAISPGGLTGPRGPVGRDAVTHWRVLCRMGQFTLIEAQLETGRTHQIRVHLAHARHPVAGDDVYGPAKPKLGLKGQALHAYCLELAHPRTGERMRFYAPPPEWFLAALRRAGWDGEAYWEEENA